MADWPTSLPHPLLAGNAGQAGNAVQRSEFSQGPVRSRQVFTKVVNQRQYSWHLSAAQMATFLSFWENDINLGASWFTVDLDIGAGLQSVEARFTAPYSDVVTKKGSWRVSGELEVRVP